MPAAVVHRVSIFPLSIPLRGNVTHAASRRSVADPVVVAVELTNGIVGYGETLPRPYVTQETVESVVQAIQTTLIPVVMGFHAESFPEALEAIEALPWHDDEGRPLPAARAAVELAMLDASLRAYHRDMDAVVQWMGLPGFGSPGSIRQIRYSGVLASDELAATLRQLRLMYWYGLRHFKLKVGTPGDRERLERVCHYLRRPLAKGRATLRIDANGAWSKESAIEWLSATAHLPISAVEQPLPRGNKDELPGLAACVAGGRARG
ncbi:MAG: enolase C-terminal domain-like protein, partial [Planctomycetota bacterium]